MTALSADRLTPVQLQGQIRRYPQGTTKIWKGGLVMINSSGYAVPAADAAGGIVVGVARTTSDAPSSNGDNDVEVLTGIFKLAASSIAQSSVGQTMHVVDDQTVDEAVGTNGVKAGVLVKYVSSTIGWVLVTGKPLGQSVTTTDVAAIAGAAGGQIADTQASTASADAVAASGGDSPTEAEFNAVVTLVNELKADMNTNATMLGNIKTSLNTTNTTLAEVITVAGTVRTMINLVKAKWNAFGGG